MRPLIALLPALVLIAGCDRQSPDAPQAVANENVSAAPAGGSELTGTVDTSKRGTAMPADAFKAPDGKPVTLASFKGKPLLVNLWATWCAPCVAEMPTLDALAAKAGDGMTVLVVSQDNADVDIAPFFKERGLKTLQPYRDTDAALGFAYGGGQLPTTVLYDADGKEVWRVVGGMDWAGPRAAELLADVLPKS